MLQSLEPFLHLLDPLDLSHVHIGSLTATGETSRGESVVASIKTCHASGRFHVSMILHQN
jgi:hypothetical protein